jgi:hypothetical protein
VEGDAGLLKMLMLLLVVSLLDAGVIVAAGADLTSTEYALRQPGLREANPIMQTPGNRCVLKLATTAAVIGIAHNLDSTGHKKAARILRWSAIIGWGGAAVWNMRQARTGGGIR